MNLYSVLIDLALLIIIGVFIFISAKRGFVRVVVEAVGLVAAVILTLTVCTPLSEYTYDIIIEPPIISAADNELHNTVDEAINGVIDKLPGFLQGYIIESGIVDEVIAENEGAISNGTHDFVKDISQNTVKPITVSILATVYSAIIMTLSLIVVRILASLLNKGFSFSIVGKANTALGGVCGLIKGVALCLAICFIINLLLPITENGIWIFNNENIEKTYIFRFLISLGEF